VWGAPKYKGSIQNEHLERGKRKGNKDPQKPKTTPTTKLQPLPLRPTTTNRKYPQQHNPKPHNTNIALFPLPHLEPSKLIEHSKFLNFLLLFVPQLERVAETSWQCSLSRLVKRLSNCFPSPPQEIPNKGPISIAHCTILDSSTCYAPNSSSCWTPCWSRTAKSVKGDRSTDETWDKPSPSFLA
jgi:hypothetical protein